MTGSSTYAPSTMERPTDARRTKGAESRRRILDAASSLMAEQGYAGTSIADVIERSGHAASSIYWHFDNKEGLLAAVIEDGAARWFDGLPDALGDDDARDGAALLGAIGRALADDPEFLRLLLLLSLERERTDPASLEAIRKVRRGARSGLAAMIRVTIDGATEDGANRLAAALLALADGAFIAHLLDPDDTDIEAMLRAFGSSLPSLVTAFDD